MSDQFREEKLARGDLGHFVGLAGESDITLETSCGTRSKASITISASMLRILLLSYDVATAGRSKWRGAA